MSKFETRKQRAQLAARERVLADDVRCRRLAGTGPRLGDVVRGGPVDRALRAVLERSILINGRGEGGTRGLLLRRRAEVAAAHALRGVGGRSDRSGGRETRRRRSRRRHRARHALAAGSLALGRLARGTLCRFAGFAAAHRLLVVTAHDLGTPVQLVLGDVLHDSIGDQIPDG